MFRPDDATKQNVETAFRNGSIATAILKPEARERR